jgi:ribonuclease HII
MKKPAPKSKPKYLIGIDEVGRGPIAGPVAVGAFRISMKDLPKVRKIFKGVKESKQLSEIKREEWFAIIEKHKNAQLIDFCVTFQSEKIIDTKGLSFSIKRALRDSLSAVSSIANDTNHCRVLLDGGLKAPTEFIDQKTIIKGDEKEMVIALASICAKVLRDRKMNKLGKKHAAYGFEVHKGYGTRRHYEVIKKHGLLPTHRRLFLRKFLERSK